MPSHTDIFSLVFRYNLEDSTVTVTVKSRTAIKVMLLYFNLYWYVYHLIVSYDDHLHPFFFLLFIVQLLLRKRGPRVAQWVRSLDLITHTSLSPIRREFAPGFVKYQKGCTRLATASDKVYQLLAHGRWFSPGTPASSTTKTGRHDIAEILLKVALKPQKSNQIKS